MNNPWVFKFQSYHRLPSHGVLLVQSYGMTQSWRPTKKIFVFNHIVQITMYISELLLHFFSSSCFTSTPLHCFTELLLTHVTHVFHCFMYSFHFLVDYSCYSIFTSSLSSCSTMMTPCRSYFIVTHLPV